jgi:hypothetical protein
MDYPDELLNAVSALDQAEPGWWRRIDLDDFDMRSCTRCVIGQAFQIQGKFSAGEFYKNILRLRANGLMPSPVFTGHGGYEEAWRHLIAARQDADRIGEELSVPDAVEVYA